MIRLAPEIIGPQFCEPILATLVPRNTCTHVRILTHIRTHTHTRDNTHVHTDPSCAMRSRCMDACVCVRCTFHRWILRFEHKLYDIYVRRMPKCVASEYSIHILTSGIHSNGIYVEYCMKYYTHVHKYTRGGWQVRRATCVKKSCTNAPSSCITLCKCGGYCFW